MSLVVEPGWTTTARHQVNTYTLDPRNRIASVGGPWDEFAADNGGVRVFRDEIRGRSLWDYVTGEVTRMWLEAVFTLARLRGETIERPYRCDSPDLKRFMRMRVISEPWGFLRVEHEILATKQRSPSLPIEFAANTPSLAKRRCSMCGRVNHDGWQEPCHEQAQGSRGILVIYTVCDDCQRWLPGTSENPISASPPSDPPALFPRRPPVKNVGP